MNKAKVNLLKLKLQLILVDVKKITAKPDQIMSYLHEKTNKNRVRAQF